MHLHGCRRSFSASSDIITSVRKTPYVKRTIIIAKVESWQRTFFLWYAVEMSFVGLPHAESFRTDFALARILDTEPLYRSPG
jgi:hypothetical protein